MYRNSLALREIQSGINAGRLRLAEQFSTMSHWQTGECERFDRYVHERRRQATYEAFDQRVERAYKVAAKSHKAEVLNATKRKLTSTGARLTAAGMMEMKAAVDDRLRWLREVWTQIDADYRSQDTARQEVAAREIAAALRGEPGEYMQWVYELKREERFKGPKGKATLQAQLETAELPDVTEDEVNRYHNLKLDMSEVERQVKLKYGLAGQQHWAELQSAKDELYAEKLDHAAAMYEKLLDQSARYDESRRSALLRSHVERVHQAQVRFKAAMELERERERLVEAHTAMQAERRRGAREARVALLQEAAELKARGVSSEAVQGILRERQLDRLARQQAEYQLKEQEEVRAKKTAYLELIDRFKSDMEEREGRELLRQPSTSSPAAGRRNAFGFDDADRLEGDTGAALVTDHRDAAGEAVRGTPGDVGQAPDLPGSSEVSRWSSRKALWDRVEANVYEDPPRTVHQARLDAVKSYDPLYAKFFPMNLVQGRKYTRQGVGEYAAGNGTDGQVLQSGNRAAMCYQWGMSPFTVHDIDGDGQTDYFFETGWHVRNKETGDIDWRYEKKRGGPIFRGPVFYRMGAAREAGEPGEQSMDPAPPSRGGGRGLLGATSASSPARRAPEAWRSA